MAWRAPGAGELRDRITIERNTKVSDGAGGFADTWEAILEDIHARITVTRGNETVQALRLSGTTPVEITIRANTLTAEIAASDRVLDARTGERFSIRWAGNLQDGRKSFLSLSCMAGEVSHG